MESLIELYEGAYVCVNSYDNPGLRNSAEGAANHPVGRRGNAPLARVPARAPKAATADRGRSNHVASHRSKSHGPGVCPADRRRCRGASLLH